jgi:hypothetical protein
MSTKTVKIIVFLALLVHGIGHFQGVVASLGINYNKKTSTESWLFRGLDKKTNTIICFILYLLAGISAILAALGFQDILLGDFWRNLAIVSAFSSLACLVLFPNALAMFFNKVGAILVNLWIFYSLLFNNQWPSMVFED